MQGTLAPVFENMKLEKLSYTKFFGPLIFKYAIQIFERAWLVLAAMMTKYQVPDFSVTT